MGTDENLFRLVPVLRHGARVLPLELVPVPGHGAQISARIPAYGYVQTGACASPLPFTGQGHQVQTGPKIKYTQFSILTA